MDNIRKSNRSNVWTCIIYPDDSLPENWMEIINSWHVATLVSPVHDADKNALGDEKKKHRHIMIYFGIGANKSENQVRELTDQLNGTKPIIVLSSNATIRYFIHKDNPEKAQRSKGMDRDWDPIKDIISFSGFEYLNAFENYSSDSQLYRCIEDIINKEVIYNYPVLIMYLREHNMEYEAMFVRKHTMFFNCYLNGIYQRVIGRVKGNNVPKNET